jgi:chlorophyll(ide) b reductase
MISVVSAFAPLASNLRPTSSLSTSALQANKGGVVITGGAGGVGFAYAGEFMERGYDVVICDVQDCSSAAKALQDRHGSSGGKIFHTKCDVSDVNDVEKLGQFAQKNLGTIGYWINNAGMLLIEDM